MFYELMTEEFRRNFWHTTQKKKKRKLRTPQLRWRDSYALQEDVTGHLRPNAWKRRCYFMFSRQWISKPWLLGCHLQYRWSKLQGYSEKLMSVYKTTRRQPRKMAQTIMFPISLRKEYQPGSGRGFHDFPHGLRQMPWQYIRPQRLRPTFIIYIFIFFVKWFTTSVSTTYSMEWWDNSWMMMMIIFIIVIYFNCKWILLGGSGNTIRHNKHITHITQNNTKIKRNTENTKLHTQ
jgi:hypothetical protein